MRTYLLCLILTACLLPFPATHTLAETISYPIVDTGQNETFSTFAKIAFPKQGQRFFGQDAQYMGNQPRYKDNNDGTVTDLVTGLMWQKSFTKKKWADAVREAEQCSAGGYTDWRLPTIKELFSLIDFRGTLGFLQNRSRNTRQPVPYINTDYFDFEYGNVQAGERVIDAQYWSSTKYASTTMGGNPTAFGVNFADGRIKGYPVSVGKHGMGRPVMKRYVRYVRKNTQYGKNNFRDNEDGTITDTATGLTWMQHDSKQAMSWENALQYAEQLTHGGHSDWRLPNAKELQSIVDYTRSPDTTSSAAINPIFISTSIRNEAGQSDYGFYWTSTTHLDSPNSAKKAVYIAFGRGIGQMHGRVMDVHGAGCQRSDPKTGNAELGHGPQGDAVRVYNLVRCVRGGKATQTSTSQPDALTSYPNNAKYGNAPSANAMQQRQAPFQHGKSEHGQMNSGDRFNRGRPMHNLMSPQPTEHSQRPTQHIQRNQSSSMGINFVRRLDKNGDNKVSRVEFDGPSHHFDVFDKNGDGLLSAEEAPPPPPGFSGRRMPND